MRLLGVSSFFWWHCDMKVFARRLNKGCTSRASCWASLDNLKFFQQFYMFKWLISSQSTSARFRISDIIRQNQTNNCCRIKSENWNEIKFLISWSRRTLIITDTFCFKVFQHKRHLTSGSKHKSVSMPDDDLIQSPRAHYRQHLPGLMLSWVKRGDYCCWININQINWFSYDKVWKVWLHFQWSIIKSVIENEVAGIVSFSFQDKSLYRRTARQPHQQCAFHREPEKSKQKPDSGKSTFVYSRYS